MSIIEKVEERKEDISIQQILVNLQDLEKSLESKTHIHKPKQLTVLWLYGKMGEKKISKETGDLISGREGFVNTFLKYMVSFNRLGRKEIVTAVTELRDKERSNAQKMVMDLK